MGETGQEALRVGFDSVIKLEFHGAQVSSDAGLFSSRDLDEAAQLTESSAAGTIANPGTNRLSGYSECRFCSYCRSVVGQSSILNLYSQGEGWHNGRLGRSASLSGRGHMGNVG
jgi:hypothetical protein